MNETTHAALRVTIVSDLVCPWCIVGYRQLQTALRGGVRPVTIDWQPFELNPRLGGEGENLRQHMMAKYGLDTAASNQARARLARLGEELGFRFEFREDMRIYNTFRAHQLLHWAALAGHQLELALALFDAYFTHGCNIDDPAALARVAATAGLDETEARQLLADGRYRQAVRERQSQWTSRGITGVPAMIFDDHYLVSGAQGVDNYSALMEQLSRQTPA